MLFPGQARASSTMQPIQTVVNQSSYMCVYVCLVAEACNTPSPGTDLLLIRGTHYTKRVPNKQPVLMRPVTCQQQWAGQNERRKKTRAKTNLRVWKSHRRVAILPDSNSGSISILSFYVSIRLSVLAVAEHAVHPPEIHTSKTAEDCAQL